MPSKTHSKLRKIVPVSKDNKDKTIVYSIDLKQAAEDNIIDVADFQKYLDQAIKINGKRNGAEITVSSKDSKVHVSTKILFSKRYVKFLTKKYLKKQEVTDYLRVIATEKLGYTVKYFNISDQAADQGK